MRRRDNQIFSSLVHVSTHRNKTMSKHDPLCLCKAILRCPIKTFCIPLRLCEKNSPKHWCKSPRTKTKFPSLGSWHHEPSLHLGGCPLTPRCVSSRTETIYVSFHATRTKNMHAANVGVPRQQPNEIISSSASVRVNAPKQLNG